MCAQLHFLPAKIKTLHVCVWTLPGQAAKLDFTAQIRSDYTVEKVESGIAQFQVWTFDNGITDVSRLRIQK